MEIKTTKGAREPVKSEIVATPEKSQYLRRKSTQKLRKSLPHSRRLVALLSFLGRLALLVLLLALGYSIYEYAYRSDAFVLRRITFMGSLHADRPSLENVIRKSSPRNLLQIDLEQLRGLIEEDCWTKRAEIRRVLPSELIVTIEERVPSVILELKGELMLADDEGILLDEYAAKYGKLDVPVFKGFLGENPVGYRRQQAENSERVKLGRMMLSELEQGSPAFSKSVSEVDLSDKSDVRVLLLDDSA